jgi:hypothetical protein
MAKIMTIGRVNQDFCMLVLQFNPNINEEITIYFNITIFNKFVFTRVNSFDLRCYIHALGVIEAISSAK